MTPIKPCVICGEQTGLLYGHATDQTWQTMTHVCGNCFTRAIEVEKNSYGTIPFDRPADQAAPAPAEEPRYSASIAGAMDELGPDEKHRADQAYRTLCGILLAAHGKVNRPCNWIVVAMERLLRDVCIRLGEPGDY